MSDAAPTEAEGSPPESYAAAAAELDGILGDLEAGSVDVDALGDRVARAAVLIRFCRDRLTAVEIEVGKIVEDLDAT